MLSCRIRVVVALREYDTPLYITSLIREDHRAPLSCTQYHCLRVLKKNLRTLNLHLRLNCQFSDNALAPGIEDAKTFCPLWYDHWTLFGALNTEMPKTEVGGSHLELPQMAYGTLRNATQRNATQRVGGPLQQPHHILIPSLINHLSPILFAYKLSSMTGIDSVITLKNNYTSFLSSFNRRWQLVLLTCFGRYLISLNRLE